MVIHLFFRLWIDIDRDGQRGELAHGSLDSLASREVSRPRRLATSHEPRQGPPGPTRARASRAQSMGTRGKSNPGLACHSLASLVWLVQLVRSRPDRGEQWVHMVRLFNMKRERDL